MHVNGTAYYNYGRKNVYSVGSAEAWRQCYKHFIDVTYGRSKVSYHVSQQAYCMIAYIVVGIIAYLVRAVIYGCKIL
jgi:hypothetical protein